MASRDLVVVTSTMRAAPRRMISSAAGTGTRIAMPSASVLAVVVSTTGPRAERLRVGVRRRSTRTPTISRGQAERVARGDQAADARAAADRHVDARRAAARRGTAPAHRWRRRAPVPARTAATKSSPRSAASACRLHARLVEIAAVLDQLGAEGAHRRVLLDASCRAARRSCTASPWRRAGVGEDLPVVAARGADDAAATPRRSADQPSM